MLLFTHYMIFFKYVNNYQSSGYRSNNRFKNILLSWCSILIEWGILWTTTLYLINVFIDPDVLNKDEAAHNIKTQPCILCSSLRREKIRTGCAHGLQELHLHHQISSVDYFWVILSERAENGTQGFQVSEGITTRVPPYNFLIINTSKPSSE